VQEGHDITIAYMNSNIHPEQEYALRRDTLLAWANEEGIPVVEGVYDPALWGAAISPIVEAPDYDRSERCRACYHLRFEEAARYAKEHGFEGIATTLSVSPYQFTEVIAEELQDRARAYGLEVVFRDFRPLYQEATRRSRSLGMYRQNFCGCRLSQDEAAEEREERKRARKAAKVASPAPKEASTKAGAKASKASKAPAPASGETAMFLKTSDFDYVLPEEKIAQEPARVRDECKLLVMNRESGALEDKIFSDIYDYIQPGDVLVANETRVMPARLFGTKHKTKGSAELLLLREVFAKPATVPTTAPDASPNTTALWEALVRPGKRLKPGARIDFCDAQGKVVLQAEIIDWAREALEGEKNANANPANLTNPTNPANLTDPTNKGERLVRLSTPSCKTLDEALHQVGHTPLPPYIKNYHGDEELYQTVFSTQEKSAAAPTAGLHFTPELIERIKAKGAYFETVELEVGLDTFRIVEEENPAAHRIHTEFYTVPDRVVDAVTEAHERGSRVIAVGTTSVRSLESAWDAQSSTLCACQHEATALYLLPGSPFNVVDALITNFHVPRSTLMMLVSAFSTRENIMKAYQHALETDYRFLSFGDAMFIV
jgi:S-adenosylmethionine:tRNA ribosyltransferase-isomerase